MNPFSDLLKKLSEGIFFWWQRNIAQRQAAQSFSETLEVMEQAAKDAAEVIDLANDLGKGDPHKQRLAAQLKDYATEGLDQVFKGRLSAKEVLAIEADHPFSENSEPSRASLPAAPKPLPTPKPSPPTPTQSQPPAGTGKRGRGRPRKQPPQQ